MSSTRTHVLAACMAGFLLGVAPASAGPLDPALQAQLLQLFDNYNKAIAAAKLDDAVAMRSRETRQSMKPYLGSAAKRKELMEFAGETIPDAIEFRHASLSKDGATATILLVARKKIPDAAAPGGSPPGSVLTAEMTLTFVKEDGRWKFADQTFGVDPAKIVACKNEAFEPLDAYDRGKDTSLGGLIDRVAFEADYTLVVVRVLAEEDCAYLPNRAGIQKAGIDPDRLVPYAVVEIDGFPHKTDKQKLWADHITIRDE